MCRGNKKLRPWIAILLILCTVYLINLTITQMAYTQSDKYNFSTSRSKDVSNTQTPFRLFGSSFFLAGLTENEIIVNMEINRSMFQNIRNINHPISRIFNMVAISTASLGTILYYSILFVSRPNRKKSLLAISIGGHAPPLFVK